MRFRLVVLTKHQRGLLAVRQSARHPKLKPMNMKGNVQQASERSVA
jgi:hypothetical protein